MPFKKGNTLWQKGIAVKKYRQDQIDEFFIVMQLGGKERYADLCDALSNGIEITKEQIEFMDRYEKLWPYVKAKKTDITTGGEKLPQPLLNGLSSNQFNEKASEVHQED